MNPNQLLFIGGVLIGGILLIVTVTGFLFKKNPPKKINSLYGYRTKSSMKNQERWDFAQKYGAQQMIKTGVLLCLFAIIGLIVLLCTPISMPTSIIIFVSVMIFGAIYLIVSTEKAIKNKFGKNE